MIPVCRCGLVFCVLALQSFDKAVQLPQAAYPSRECKLSVLNFCLIQLKVIMLLFGNYLSLYLMTQQSKGVKVCKPHKHVKKFSCYCAICQRGYEGKKEEMKKITKQKVNCSLLHLTGRDVVPLDDTMSCDFFCLLFFVLFWLFLCRK